MDTHERKVWGERRPKDMVTLQIILVFTLTLTCPKTFTHGHVSVFDKYLHWLRVNVYIYKLQQDKCKCKSFTLTLDLHIIYMAKLTLTCTTLVQTHKEKP
jgi:hypothetical protein